MSYCPACRCTFDLAAREGAVVSCPDCDSPLIDEGDVVVAVPVDAETIDAVPVEIATAEVDDLPIPPPVQFARAHAVAQPDDEVQVLPMSAVVAMPLPAESRQKPQLDLETMSSSSLSLTRDDDIVVLPASAVVAVPAQAAREANAFPGAAKPTGKLDVSRRARRVQWMTYAGGGGVLLLLVAAAVLLAINPFDKTATPQARWDAADAIYKEQEWNRAQQEFAKFKEDFPDDHHAEQVPFFLDMCAAGEEIFPQFGDSEQGLVKAEQIFQTHRDNPAYKLYCSDLFLAAKRLVENFCDQAAKTYDPAKIESARRAQELASTVAQAVEAEWVPETVAKLESRIDEAEKVVKVELARREARTILERLQTSDPVPNVDEEYARVDLLFATPLHSSDKSAVAGKQSTLADDKQLRSLRSSAELAEAKRVKFVPIDQNEVAPATEPQSIGSQPHVIPVVWSADNPPLAAPAALNSGLPSTVMALARGVLYVFDAQGNYLWSRRLGIDSQRLPGRVTATASSPASLVCVSTENNTLLALEAATGRVLWEYRVGGDILAPLTIVTIPGGPRQADKTRGFLPVTAADGLGGEIHVIEMVLGRKLGHYAIGQPVSVGGAFDPLAKLAYFAADAKRLFALDPLAIEDPARPACRSVLIDGHASGSLRSAPAVVDKYLVLPAAGRLEGMELGVHLLDAAAGGFANPREPPIKRLSLTGWSWFDPLSAADRITLVTDDGDLGVFGLNLDNVDEALFRLVENTSPERSGTRLAVSENARSLAVHADEHLLWVMAGGSLRKLSLDILHQQIKQLWPNEQTPAEVTGVPLHEAQRDRRGDVFYLTTTSLAGGRCDATAVDSATGERLWQRQLGVRPAGDPLVVDGGVLLIDRSGRTLRVDAPSTKGATSVDVLEASAETTLPAGTDVNKIQRIVDELGATYLVAPIESAASVALAPIDVAAAGKLDWQIVNLPAPLAGQPCVQAGFLMASCADGRLYRVPLSRGKSLLPNEQSFVWHLTPAPQIDLAAVYPLDADSLLMVDSERRVSCLDFHAERLAPQWERQGSYYESSSPLLGRAVVHGDRAYVADVAGAVLALDLRDPSRVVRSWKLPAPLTGDLCLRAGKLTAVVGERRIVCLDPSTDEGDQPLWTGEVAKGRIRGEPQIVGKALVFVDDGRRATGLSMATGQPMWSTRFGVRSGPAAAAVPFGNNQLIVPLTDGTLLQLAVPQPDANAATESAP